MSPLAVAAPASAAAEPVTAGSAAQPTSVGAGALAGTWKAVDSGTRGLVWIEIAEAHDGITVHAFGACAPRPCDWGEADGRAYAASVDSTDAVAFSATYYASFKLTTIVGAVDNGVLTVETFSHFTDGSDRSDLYTKGYFAKV